MTNYLEQIDQGLVLEQPKIVLLWNWQKKDIFNILNDVSIVNQNYYTSKIVLPNITFINYAGFHFKKEKLVEIELFNDAKHLAEADDSVFNKHQLILEECFGKPNRNKLIEIIKEVKKAYYWKFKHVTIIHKLWDRFGMEENLIIHIQ